MKIYLNGKFVQESEAKISVFDHGLLYGDGVFEGIRVYSGRIFKLSEHIKRLYVSASAIMLGIPMTQEEFCRAVEETTKVNGVSDGYIRVVVTRGSGNLGLDPRECKEPTVIIIADEIKLYPEEYYEQGLEIITASTRRNSPDALNPMIKSLNYLNNILGKLEATRLGVPEAVMLNRDGYVAECTGDNIFIYKNGELLTPPCSIGALDGITRQLIIQFAREKLRLTVREALFTQFDVQSADECFVCGTGAEILPVVKIDSRPVNGGKVGKITRQLIQEYRRITREG